MTKNKTPFEKINIPDEAMETVGEFKAITAQGKSRPILSTEEHRKLVSEKYIAGQEVKEHITLFRVQDKKGLPPTEKNEHTVQGPNWTPPSSIAFVLGALSNGDRVWLATMPNNSSSGLCDKKGDPAIYARELTAVIIQGWSARETKEEECYGAKSKKQPALVLTPPSSPRPTSHKDLQSVMDVKTTWNELPRSAEDLAYQLTPVTVEFSDFLKTSKLHKMDFDTSTFKNIENLVKQKLLSPKDLEDIQKDVKIKLLQDAEVTTLLIKGEAKAYEVKQIYIEYLETTDSIFGEFNFNEMYNLINTHKQEFELLVLGLDLTIKEVIEIYKTDREMFFDFSNPLTVTFYQKYIGDIDLEDLEEIYHTNRDLYQALIADPKRIVEEAGVRNFIDMYEQAQRDINSTPDSDYYKNTYDPYDFVDTKLSEDGCPDEIMETLYPEEYDDFEEEIYPDYDSALEQDPYFSEYSDMDPDEYNQISAQLDMLLSGDMCDSEDEFL